MERRRLRAVLLFVVIAGGIPTVQGFREDEVECEEAVAYLDDCCPNFDPSRIRCTFVSGCNYDTYPSLAPSESECILKTDCGELSGQKICDRVLARQSAGGSSGSTNAEVCP